MLKTMDLQTACNAILAFAEANQVDELTGIEYMVKYYTQLSPRERLALGVFMDETKERS
jgi:hypothetical protein